MSSLRRKIRNKLARRLGVPEIPFALERLKDSGFAPKVVFDVGAYRGDFAVVCNTLWPSADVFCFEVLPVPSARIATLAAEGARLRLMNCLLGSQVRESVTFHMAETASSILTEIAAPQKRTSQFQMRTVDDVVVGECGGRAPDFLKMDVQGYELEVLKGAVKSLSGVSVILAEVNLLDIHRGVPLLAEVIAWLDSHGFVAFDICGLGRRPLDQALWQADFIFVRESSPLRSDKRYAR